jgi:hypothetical protein
VSLRLIASARPRVHHDALDWARRVAANGGAVSQSTLRAVSTFCNAIDRAGIRDRFYRLNLFCGTGLSACLVPLYRGQSLSGTQYGETTDTNNGPFVSGDYVETGASGGLQAVNNTSKYLATGLNPFTAGLSEQNYHNSGYFPATLNTTFFIASTSTFGHSLFSGAFSTLGMYVRFGGGFNSGLENAAVSARNGHLLGQRSGGTGVGYRNGININATSNTSGSSAFASGMNSLFVFAINTGSAASQHFSGRACMYSVGLNFTDAQALAFYNAVQTFQTALGRQL